MNLFDYLEWRGDLDFYQDPVNQIDNLILSQLSYLNLSGIVPSSPEDKPVSIKDAARKYANASANIPASESKHEALCRLTLTKMAETKRFQKCQLTGYQKIVSMEKECQFAVVTILLPRNKAYISYSGTDGSLAGWRENLNMIYLEHIPGQVFALRYLSDFCAASHRGIYVGGHSKGGNLAVYASMHLDEECQKQIIKVYNNDGPGFSEDILKEGQYEKVRNKVCTIIPESSVVGLLLEHESKYLVVKSSGHGIEQHSVYTWQVKGNSFIFATTPDEASIRLEQMLNEWLSKVDLNQRKEIVDRLFDAFERHNITSSDSLSHMNFRQGLDLMHDIQHLDPNHINDFKRIVKLYLSTYSRVTTQKHNLREYAEHVRSALGNARRKLMLDEESKGESV